MLDSYKWDRFKNSSNDKYDIQFNGQIYSLAMLPEINHAIICKGYFCRVI